MTYLEKQIQAYGLDAIKKIYLESKHSDFLAEFHCASKTAVILFGRKFKEYRKQRKSEPVVYPKNMRWALNTHKWEIPKEENYWEKSWFEIKREWHIRTKLLP